MTRRSRRALTAACAGALGALVVTCLAPSTAHAIPPILRPSRGKPWFFQGGLGGSLEVHPGRRSVNRFGRFFREPYNLFKLTQEIGYHFSGDMEGPAIGAYLGESFGHGIIRFNGAFRFWYDIQPKDDLALYITPFAHAGYGGWFAASSAHTVNVQLGVEARLTLKETAVLFLRPFAPDMYFGDAVLEYGENFTLYHDIILGGGVVW